MATKKAAAIAAHKKTKAVANKVPANRSLADKKTESNINDGLQAVNGSPVLAPRKATIHPNYREISVEMTDGTTFKTYSTYQNNLLKLDVDVKTHPAWTKEANYVNVNASAVAKFNNKFQGLSFISKKIE